MEDSKAGFAIYTSAGIGTVYAHPSNDFRSFSRSREDLIHPSRIINQKLSRPDIARDTLMHVNVKVHGSSKVSQWHDNVHYAKNHKEDVTLLFSSFPGTNEDSLPRSSPISICLRPLSHRAIFNLFRRAKKRKQSASRPPRRPGAKGGCSI